MHNLFRGTGREVMANKQNILRIAGVYAAEDFRLSKQLPLPMTLEDSFSVNTYPPNADHMIIRQIRRAMRSFSGGSTQSIDTYFKACS